MTQAVDKISSLPLWRGAVTITPLAGGLTNKNYLAVDDTGKYVVRLGEDIVEHQVMRFNELAASKAAYAAGISPSVVYHQPGILVLDFIASKTLGPQDVQNTAYLQRIIALVRRCHMEIPKHLRGASQIFWVFHILRDYCATLRENESAYVKLLPELLARTQALESASGPHEIVFGHNDLLAANFLDDGKRIWLIDWDYAGFNSPLFDLGGLASNNQFDETQEKFLLETYFEAPLNDALWRRYQAMKCASLLRETLWSMVSEIFSDIDFDYREYTGENLARFEKAFDEFTQQGK